MNQGGHQDLISRATHRLSFPPVQMVDPSAGHAAEPATGSDENDLGPFSLRRQSCHHAAGILENEKSFKISQVFEEPRTSRRAPLATAVKMNTNRAG